MRIATVTPSSNGRSKTWTGTSVGKKCAGCNVTLRIEERVLIHGTFHTHIDCLLELLVKEETFAERKKMQVRRDLMECAASEAEFLKIRQELAKQHGVELPDA